MAVTEAQKRATKKDQEKRDAIMLRPPLETGARIRSAAEAAGKSVTGFIMDTVMPEVETIEKEGIKGNA